MNDCSCWTRTSGRLQQKCSSEVFFFGLGEGLKKVAAIFLIQIENDTLIPSFNALLSCITTLRALLYFGLLCYNHGFFFISCVHPDRGLKFLKGFLTEVKNGEKNIQTALSKCQLLYSSCASEFMY